MCRIHTNTGISIYSNPLYLNKGNQELRPRGPPLSSSILRTLPLPFPSPPIPHTPPSPFAYPSLSHPHPPPSIPPTSSHNPPSLTPSCSLSPSPSHSPPPPTSSLPPHCSLPRPFSQILQGGRDLKAHLAHPPSVLCAKNCPLTTSPNSYTFVHLFSHTLYPSSLECPSFYAQPSTEVVQSPLLSCGPLSSTAHHPPYSSIHMLHRRLRPQALSPNFSMMSPLGQISSHR